LPSHAKIPKSAIAAMSTADAAKGEISLEEADSSANAINGLVAMNNAAVIGVDILFILLLSASKDEEEEEEDFVHRIRCCCCRRRPKEEEEDEGVVVIVLLLNVETIAC